MKNKGIKNGFVIFRRNVKRGKSVYLYRMAIHVVHAIGDKG